jgi:acetyl-CoA C-acetyltransferase
VLARSGVAAADIDSVIAGNMAPGDFDQFFLPRHIGLYAGVPVDVPAIMAQRICGTGFELFRQAAEQIAGRRCERALVVGTESHDAQPDRRLRPPHRLQARRSRWVQGLHVGGAERPGGRSSMIQTAENLAKKYGITREDVDAFAAVVRRAVAAQDSGFLAGEIVPVVTRSSSSRATSRAGSSCRARRPRWPTATPTRAVTAGGAGQATPGVRRRRADRRQQLGADRRRGGCRGELGCRDARLGRPAAGARGGRRGGGRAARDHGHRPGAGHPVAAGAQRAGLADIARFEVNEAQGAQTLAVGTNWAWTWRPAQRATAAPSRWATRWPPPACA